VSGATCGVGGWAAVVGRCVVGAGRRSTADGSLVIVDIRQLVAWLRCGVPGWTLLPGVVGRLPGVMFAAPVPCRQCSTNFAGHGWRAMGHRRRFDGAANRIALRRHRGDRLARMQ